LTSIILISVLTSLGEFHRKGTKLAKFPERSLSFAFFAPLRLRFACESENAPRCRHPLRIPSSLKCFACGLAAVSSDIPARFRLTDQRLTLLSLSVVSGLVEAILRLITAATTNNFGLLWQTVNPQINR
jgi:hypothetical protein